MPLNDYVTLGASGLRVSPLCLGAMTFGEDWGWGADERTSRRMLDAYLDQGGNFIDTANIYTKGHSEAIIGEHLAETPAKRERAVIATKFGGSLHTGDPNAGGAHRFSIMRNVEDSLRRLRTDRVDLYWMHFHDPHTPVEETLRALDDLTAAGKVRYIGFSDTPAWRCARAQTIASFRGWAPLVGLQIEYSLIERSVEGDLIPMACEMGMGVTPWGPLKGGILSGKYTRHAAPEQGRYGPDSRHLNERTFRIVDALREISQETGASVPQVALAWLRQRLGVASVIIGARRFEQFEDNIQSAFLTLSEGHMDRLDRASEIELPFPHGFLERTVPPIIAGGTSINARRVDPWPIAPADESERW